LSRLETPNAPAPLISCLFFCRLFSAWQHPQLAPCTGLMSARQLDACHRHHRCFSDLAPPLHFPSKTRHAPPNICFCLRRGSPHSRTQHAHLKAASLMLSICVSTNASIGPSASHPSAWQQREVQDFALGLLACTQRCLCCLPKAEASPPGLKSLSAAMSLAALLQTLRFSSMHSLHWAWFPYSSCSRFSFSLHTNLQNTQNNISGHLGSLMQSPFSEAHVSQQQ